MKKLQFPFVIVLVDFFLFVFHLLLVSVHCSFSFILLLKSDKTAHTWHQGVLIANYRIDLLLRRQLSV